MPKKLLLIAASLFLIWQSVNLLTQLPDVGETSWGQAFFLAFLLNLYLTGMFAFAGFALPTQKLLPASYYQIHHARRLKTFYSGMGVPLFRQFLLATFWRSKSQQKRYFNGKRDGLAHLETQSMKSEFGHLLPGIVIAVVVVYLLFLGLYLVAVFTMLLNILANLYPILLQRHHRMRISVLKKRQRRKEVSYS